MRFCGARESLNTLPLTLLEFLGHGLCIGANKSTQVRAPTPSLCWRCSLLLKMARHLFTAGLWQFIFFLLSFFVCFTAVVNLDNSVVDLETLQALYENVSNRRNFKCEYMIHTQCLLLDTSGLIALIRKCDLGSLNLSKYRFVKILSRNILGKCVVHSSKDCDSKHVACEVIPIPFFLTVIIMNTY